MIRTISGAGLLLVASPVAAQVARDAQFFVGDGYISLPVPTGFCVPRGERAADAKRLADSDTDNVTHLQLEHCDKARSDLDYYLFKTPKEGNALISRAELIAMLLETPDVSGAKTILDPAKLDAEAARVVEKRFDATANPASGSGEGIETLGHDDVCVYLGGFLTVELAGRSARRTVGACITAVSRHPVVVYRYRDGEPGNLVRSLADAKRVAESMTGLAPN